MDEVPSNKCSINGITYSRLELSELIECLKNEYDCKLGYVKDRDGHICYFTARNKFILIRIVVPYDKRESKWVLLVSPLLAFELYYGLYILDMSFDTLYELCEYVRTNKDGIYARLIEHLNKDVM